MVGTIGPLVRGLLPRRSWRLQITILFAGGFIAGSVITFSLSYFLGAAVRIHQLPFELRNTLALAGLMVLAFVEVRARHSGTYCPLGLGRQTPRVLMRYHSMLVVALIWGFDT